MNPPASTPEESVQLRVYGAPDLPTLIYLPGVHGDWTLVGSFRARVLGSVRFVEFTYPRTVTWSLEDYAAAIETALRAQGITGGWLLGESFGSQVAWKLVERAARAPHASQPAMAWNGLVLAGGFVRHPTATLARVSRWLWEAAPLPCLFWFLHVYLKFAQFRHRHAPETMAGMAEFAARRNAQDRLAMGHRLGLLAANHPEPTAQQTTLPVYYVSGWIDPVVPWPWVRAYLRRRCPGFRESQIIWPADHNILGTAPETAARHVLRWIRE